MSGCLPIVEREEELYRTGHYQAVRRFRSGKSGSGTGTVIVKRCFDDATGNAWAALVAEYRILQRLDGGYGCPRAIALQPDAMELILEDFEGLPLAQSGLLGGSDPHRFLTIAVAVAESVAAVHEHGIVHRGIDPEIIRVNPDDLSLILTRFSVATTFASEQSLASASYETAHVTPYMSPEQTGWTNRPLDYRTDLYSLGATLYALATGHFPFSASHSLALVHAVLAEQPRPPRELAPWLPEEIGEIILTLLSKDPDDRYQSARGVAFDLRAMADALDGHRPLNMVPRRTRDLPLFPRSPGRLFGREKEISAMTDAFAAITRGGARSLFVAGYSGVGKSVLVRELIRPVTLAGGVFLAGKCEQFQTDVPFLAPLQCLRRMVQWLMAGRDDERADIRQRIIHAVGLDGGALIEAIPDLEMVIGQLPPAQDLPPQQAQVRLQTLLVAVVREVASPGRPVVLFLDDMQWADQPTLSFLVTLLDAPGLEGLLLVAAYRDNEVDAAHPLTRVLHGAAETGGSAGRLHLEPLAPRATNGLVADMLHTAADDVATLTAQLRAKTGGNPFFTIELVKTLFREGALVPDPAHGRWRWNDDAIARVVTSDNVVDFLTASMGRKPESVPDTLVTAACLGAGCDLETMGRAAGLTAEEAADHLRLPLEYGIIVTGDVLAFERAKPSTGFWFCHDRMQQAVYQSRDGGWRLRRHLAIARNLVGGHDFQAALHYLESAHLIETAEEKADVRALFLLAAGKSRRAGAFPAAERLVRGALSLLPPDARNEAARLDAELHLVLYSQAKYDEADEVYARLLGYVADPLTRVDAACSQIRSLSNRVRYGEAVALGAAFLRELDCPIPLDDPSPALADELERFYRHAAAGAIDRLGERIAPDDPRQAASAKALSGMIGAAFFSQPQLASWLTVHLGNRWLEEGYRRDYIYPVACIAMSTIGLRGDYSTGYRAARAALEAGTRLESSVETARSQHVFALFNCHWFEPALSAYGYAKRSFAQTTRDGDLAVATLTFFASLATMTNFCGHVSKLKEEVAAALDASRKTSNRHAGQSYMVFRQLIRALEGDTLAPGAFGTADFVEARHLADIAANPMARCYFHIYRALSALVFDDRPGLIANTEAMLPLLPNIVGFYPTGLANQLHSFALLERLDEESEPQRAALLKQVETNQAWLAARAADAPGNFASGYHWIEAERLDRVGKPWEAIWAFQQAMRHAGGDLRPLQLAVITERAGRFYLRHGMEVEAHHLLRTAHVRYEQWGASGKGRDLRARYPFIDSVGGTAAASLERDALLTATQALASEVTLSGLLDRLVPLMGQLTGATDVRFIMAEDGGDWVLKDGLHQGARLERSSLAEAAARHLLPLALCKTIPGMREPLRCDDTAADSRFMGDPHYGTLPHCSLLALPIRLHGVPRAALVLENQLFRAAFTERKAEAVSVICAQLAVSVENIRLYESLERKVAERTQELARRNEEQSRFITMLGHELRMPLSVIRMALRKDGPLGPVNQRRCIQAVGDINDVVECCLYADRLEHGRIEVAPEPVDLAAILKTAAESQPEGNRIDIRATDLPILRTDRRIISVIVNNLIGNAVKYGHPGAPVDVQAQRDGTMVALIVSNAIGTAGSPDPEKVFEKYYRSPQACGKTGSGLGLFIAASFARMIGGDLRYCPDEANVRFELKVPA